MDERQHREALDEAAWVAVSAIDEVAENIANGVLLQEPEMNGAMASHLASAFRKRSLRGIQWRARHLTSMGQNTEENAVGADLIVAIRIALPDYTAEKGLLIQNKRDGRCTASEKTRLLGQINKMSNHTSSKWVCVLAGQRFRFDSGATVRGRGGRFSYREARIPAFTFFRDFFRCKTGDEKITLQRASELYRVADGNLDVVELEALPL